jgi:D-alanyl-D-alanine dipeptidase
MNWFAIGIIYIFCFSGVVNAEKLPDGFVYIVEVIPDIVIELRYAGSNNFIGAKIDGYQSERCIITAEAAYALKRVQKRLNLFGLGLKIFDAYRPQRAVDHFMRWAEDTADIKMKEHYYPAVKKAKLFEKGYVSAKSGHSRGSTVDLTLIDLESGKDIDMGSPFDFFDEKSHTRYTTISAQQRANRMLLNLAITGSGFKAYDKEWWHFTLENEPFPETYFDFVIE